LTGIGNAVSGNDFTLASQTITFPANSTTAVTVNVPVIDNNVGGIDKFFPRLGYDLISCYPSKFSMNLLSFEFY
jgi:hypothetical protein